MPGNRWQLAARDAAVLHGRIVLDTALDDVRRTMLHTPEQTQFIHTAGLQDVSNSLVDDRAVLNDILRMNLEVIAVPAIRQSL